MDFTKYCDLLVGGYVRRCQAMLLLVGGEDGEEEDVVDDDVECKEEEEEEDEEDHNEDINQIIHNSDVSGIVAVHQHQHQHRQSSQTIRMQSMSLIPKGIIRLLSSFYPVSLEIHHSGVLEQNQSIGHVISHKQLDGCYLHFQKNWHLIEMQITQVYPQSTFFILRSMKNQFYEFRGSDGDLQPCETAGVTEVGTQKMDIKLVSSSWSTDRRYFVTQTNEVFLHVAYAGSGSGTNGNTRVVFRYPFSQMIVSDIRCGHNHTLFLFDSGDVCSFGSNSVGQCGFDAKEVAYITTPTHIPQLNEI